MPRFGISICFLPFVFGIYVPRAKIIYNIVMRMKIAVKYIMIDRNTFIVFTVKPRGGVYTVTV